MSEYIAKCNEVVGISGKTLIVPDYIDTSEEIVRCRDCANFEKTAGRNGICRRSKFLPMWAEPDGFCAWAVKRKEGGDD